MRDAIRTPRSPAIVARAIIAPERLSWIRVALKLASSPARRTRRWWPEDAEGFLVASRGGQFLFVPFDCMPPEDVGELRLLPREMLGGRARLR